MSTHTPPPPVYTVTHGPIWYGWLIWADGHIVGTAPTRAEARLLAAAADAAEAALA